MPIKAVSEGRLSVLIRLSALLTDAMFVTPVVSVKLLYFSNYLPSTVENDFISRDDVTGDKIIIRAISYITNADIIFMGEQAPRLRQLDAVRQEIQDVK
jgi:isocitrate lyase